MRRLTTADGSETFYNDEVGDVYHTKSGAVEEAFLKYVEPSEIAEIARRGRVRILDICFGLGYNACAAIDRALEVNPDCEIRIVGLENDDMILGKTMEVNPPLENYHIIKEVAEKKGYSNGKIKIRLIMGDARDTIKNIDGMFDAVFLDPFSPAKQPDLWQEGFFMDIMRRMRKGAILATYSYARMVRENLKTAGFIVSDGPTVGRRSPSTLAEAP